MEFPSLVYKDGGQHQRKGGTFDYQQVENEQEHAAALKGGWFPSVEEAVAGKLNEASKGVSKGATKKAAEEALAQAKALEEAAAKALEEASNGESKE